MNEHAIDVIDAYLEADRLNVPHALLITGQWGSGKSFFLEKIYAPHRRKRLREQRRTEVPFLFVSLFGATSASDVEMRMYKTANPAEAVVGSIAGTLALGIGEFFRVKDTTKGVRDALGKKAIKRLNEYVFVFDDLERIESKAFGEVMGLINALIAEHGRRVLLVTDEDRLKRLVEGEVWNEQNEKIVGRRVHIEPDLLSVLQVSIAELPDGAARTFIADQRDDLLEVARISEIENLRNLSWGMHNVAAFASCLLSDSDIPKMHVALTLKVVLATTLWLRSGLLDPEALERLPGLSMTLAVRSMSRENREAPLEQTVSRAKRFSETFGSLNVDSPPIDYSFIIQFEHSGVLDTDEVITWVKTQFGFGSQHAEASWRRLWHSHERPIAETDRAILDLKQELAQNEHTQIGPILHSAGLAVRQQEVNDRRLTGGVDVVEFFEKYIDYLSDKGLLERIDFDYLGSRDDSFGGLGYSSQDTDEFQQISRHLRSRSKSLASAVLHAEAEAVLDEAIDGNLEALYKFIRSDSKLSEEPVLMNIPVERLAGLMAQDVPALRAGSKLLAYRYHDAGSGAPILQEIPWARKVHSAVLEKLAGWPEPHRTMAENSMNGLIKHYEQGKQPDDMIIPPQATDSVDGERP